MSNVFLADPIVLKAEGGKIKEAAENFRTNTEKIYSNIAEMTERSYISDGARAIAADILTFKDDLENMARVIEDYGNFASSSAVTVIRNEQNISDTYKVNGVNAQEQ